MAYPQPVADQYAIDGFKFFRLNTKLESAGDIYESSQSAFAFAIGPDSDVAKVNVAYFDREAPDGTFMQQVAISPERAFTGFIAALNTTGKFSPAQRPGRFLIWNDAIYNADYLPTGFDPIDDKIEYIPPVLDVIQYFTPPPTLESQRNDKQYLFQHLPIPIRNLYIMIPYYGRRYGFVSVKNSATGDIDFTLTGINFTIAQNNITNINQETQLDAATVTNPNVHRKIITATTDGMFDYLRITLAGSGGIPVTGATPLKIVVSDLMP